MITAIQPIEADGQFWIDISIDGCALNRRGPFATIDEVEAAATRLAAICRGLLRQPVHIAPTVAASASSPTPALEKQHPTARALRE